MRGEFYQGGPGARLFSIKMARFYELLTEQVKANWALIYKRLKGEKWQVPEKDKRGIKVEPRIESLEEIDKLTRKPGRGAWHE